MQLLDLDDIFNVGDSPSPAPSPSPVPRPIDMPPQPHPKAGEVVTDERGGVRLADPPDPRIVCFRLAEVLGFPQAPLPAGWDSNWLPSSPEVWRRFCADAPLDDVMAVGLALDDEWIQAGRPDLANINPNPRWSDFLNAPTAPDDGRV